jgi:MFS family permease
MPSHLRARAAFVLVCLGSFVASLDTTVNTAFPVITAAFSLPLRDIQWVVIPFVLAQSSTALVSGYLGDRLGHLRVFAFGLAASAAAHAAVALAPDFPGLIAARVLQGAAVGIAVACAPALATLLFPPHEKARVLVWYAAATSFAMALGPWLGGLLIEAFGWPGVFWFRVPLSVIALLLLPVLLPASVLPTRPAASARSSGFDWRGALGLTAVLSCLVLALAEFTAPGQTAALALPLLALGLIGLALFVRHEARVPHPVLRMEPFASLRFSGTQFASVAVNFACFANLLLLPYALTREAAVPIAAAGLLLSAYPGGAVLGSLLAGRLASGWQRGRALEGSPAFFLMAIGLIGAALGLSMTAAILYLQPSPALLALGMLASGLGQGIFQAGYMDATTSLLPIEERGVAGSLISVTRLFGIVLGATGIGSLQAATQSYAASFLVLGCGLAVFAVLFGWQVRADPQGRQETAGTSA